MDKYPEIINLEIMSRCNLKCIHCKLQHQVTKATNDWMSMDDFIRYIDRIRCFITNAKEFMFSSVEPLLHPHLFDMMDYISNINHKMEFPIQTNGMFLTSDIVNELAERNVPWVSIALDGINEEQVTFFKKGTVLKTVVDNIKLLRNQMPKTCKIRTVFVSNTENISSLIDYVYLCKSLGVDAIDVNGLFCYDEKLQKYALYTSEGNETVERIFLAAKEVGDRIGILVQVPMLRPQYIACEWDRVLCIDGDGYVNPCVMLSQKVPFYFLNESTEGKVVRFGNILDCEVDKIWGGDDCVEFHNNLKQRVIQDECRLCAEGYGVVCSNR